VPYGFDIPVTIEDSKSIAILKNASAIIGERGRCQNVILFFDANYIAQCSFSLLQDSWRCRFIVFEQFCFAPLANIALIQLHVLGRHSLDRESFLEN
jgi:hypothetical protein